MTENTTNIIPEQTEGANNVVENVKKNGLAPLIVVGVVGLVGLGIHMIKKHRAKKLAERSQADATEEAESSLDELLNSVE